MKEDMKKNKKKIAFINFSLSEIEQKRIKKLAKKSGKTISAFIRSKILEDGKLYSRGYRLGRVAREAIDAVYETNDDKNTAYETTKSDLSEILRLIARIDVKEHSEDLVDAINHVEVTDFANPLNDDDFNDFVAGYTSSDFE